MEGQVWMNRKFIYALFSILCSYGYTQNEMQMEKPKWSEEKVTESNGWKKDFSLTDKQKQVLQSQRIRMEEIKKKINSNKRFAKEDAKAPKKNLQNYSMDRAESEMGTQVISSKERNEELIKRKREEMRRRIEWRRQIENTRKENNTGVDDCPKPIFNKD